MATITYSYDSEMSAFEVAVYLSIGSGTAASPIQIAPSETVTFDRQYGTESVLFSNFNSANWTSSANVTNTGADFSKIVSASCPRGSSFPVTLTSNGTVRTLYFIYPAYIRDESPANIGPTFVDQTAAEPSTVYTVAYTIAGLGPDASGNPITVNASVLSPCETSVNSGTFDNSTKTVKNGDILNCIMTSGTFSSVVETTVTVGSLSTLWKLTTRPNLNSLPMIRMNNDPAVPVSLNTANDFFSNTVNKNLRGLLRGGLHVPDLSLNQGIPFSGTLNLSQLRGGYTVLYFTKTPAHKSYWVEFPVNHTPDTHISNVKFTINGGTGYTSDWEIGYAPNQEHQLEYKYEILTEEFGGAADSMDAISYYSRNNGATWADYHPDNEEFKIELVQGSAKMERNFSGTVRMTARSLRGAYGQVEFSGDFSWSLIHYNLL